MIVNRATKCCIPFGHLEVEDDNDDFFCQPTKTRQRGSTPRLCPIKKDAIIATVDDAIAQAKADPSCTEAKIDTVKSTLFTELAPRHNLTRDQVRDAYRNRKNKTAPAATAAAATAAAGAAATAAAATAATATAATGGAPSGMAPAANSAPSATVPGANSAHSANAEDSEATS